MSGTTVYLIRHGACESSHERLNGRGEGVPLTPEGRAQAEALASDLSSVPFHAIYASPLERTRETASPLAHACNLAVKILPEFHEVDYGDWTLKRFDELSALPDWNRFNVQRASTPIPSGESFLEIQARILRGFEKLRAEHPGQTVAVFSHCDVIRAAVAQVIGIPLDHLLRIEVHPASVSVLKLEDWGPKLLLLNRPYNQRLSTHAV